jgi:hypothetical protein
VKFAAPAFAVTAVLVSAAGLGCGSSADTGADPARENPTFETRAADSFSREEVVPFPVTIGGKEATYDPAAAKERPVNGAPAAVLPGDVPSEAPVVIDAAAYGKVVQVFLYAHEINDAGKSVGRVIAAPFQKGASQGKLPKLKPGVEYLVTVVPFLQTEGKGAKGPRQVRIRIKTAAAAAA